MRMIRRLLCTILATVIMISLSMPLVTKAATTTNVQYDSFEDKWETYNSIDEIIDDILSTEEIYCRNIRQMD